MSLYSEYIQEREDKLIVENDKGFATYIFTNGGVYIQDLYVRPQYRKEHVATQLANEIVKIAKESGYTRLYGSVAPSTKNSTDSIKVLLSYGFKLDSAGPNAIFMVKEI